MKPLALILHASGTNRDQDVAQALELAGAQACIVHVNAILRGQQRLSDAQMLVLPGGFSYGDALGAGKLMALDLQTYLADSLQEFVATGKPVIGICNGFQALVKADVLPGWDDLPRAASLVNNEGGNFYCGWVTLRPEPNSVCLWTRNLAQPIECPVAHGEGRFTVCDPGVLDRLRANGQIALTYDGFNPNGSQADIAGICNVAGNVLGLMPHPEDHVHPWQHPEHTRGVTAGSGLPLFEAGVRAVK
ncbi:MAG TPA: phosphoribosylformylglycinamidine synthase I [Aggregatilineales bacterium]|nr:phosphoribosylformylglycinamidine synthase I [Aggregatilineales bacterium]